MYGQVHTCLRGSTCIEVASNAKFPSGYKNISIQIQIHTQSNGVRRAVKRVPISHDQPTLYIGDNCYTMHCNHIQPHYSPWIDFVIPSKKQNATFGRSKCATLWPLASKNSCNTRRTQGYWKNYIGFYYYKHGIHPSLHTYLGKLSNRLLSWLSLPQPCSVK